MRAGAITARAKAIGARASSTDRGMVDIDWVLSTFLQIALALLIIYVMASVMFMSNTKAQVTKLKKGLEFYIGRWNAVVTTEKGQLYIGMEKALIELQKQRLMVAMETVLNQQRKAIGLDFSVKQEGSQKQERVVQFMAADVLDGDKVINPQFKRGCSYARSIFSPEKASIRDAWLSELMSRILAVAEIRPRDPGTEVNIMKEGHVLTGDNADWLTRTLAEKANSIEVETLAMQQAAVAHLYRYYYGNTERLRESREGAAISKQIGLYLSASPDEQGAFADSVAQMIRDHARAVFERQGAPLLDAIEQ